MNKKYIVSNDGTVTIITDAGETIERKEKYNESTDTILSLENLSESTKNKIQLFERRLNELNSKIRNESRVMRILNIILIMLAFALLILSTSMSSVLSLTLILTSIPFGIAVAIVEKTIIKKDKEKRKHCNKMISEGQHQINKIQKRIAELEQNNNPIKQGQFPTEIKSINTIYKIDPPDYFIGNYLIEKRVKEMTKGKKKVKKKTNNRNSFGYEF